MDALRAEQTGLRRADQPDDAELRAAQGSQDRLHFRRLGRTGAFWQSESYDRTIRDDEELTRTVLYIANNPVKEPA